MIDRILNISDSSSFEELALEIYRYQAVHCAPYRRYIELMEVGEVDCLKKIPFMPIELFKSHEIYYNNSVSDSELQFTSSGTTGSVQSTHYVKESLIYEKSFFKAFEQFYDKAENCNIYALLPSYLERDGSSLIYMITKLIEKSNDGGFFLYNHHELLERIAQRDRTKKTILFGVSFALLDMAEQYKVDFGDEVIVMETGGMKGRRKELPREELHTLLCNSLGVSKIHSEYGMCECLSQSYSDGDGIFRSPWWMKIMVRDIHDPFLFLPNGSRGGVNIVDLANIYSCSFLQTKDIGIVADDGSFQIEGRMDFSDIRGCNLLINS